MADVPSPLAAAIDDLVAAAVACGRTDLAHNLSAARARWPEPTATVVVVGESGAGRTTVVNALAGRLEPPLLPFGGRSSVVRVGADERVSAHPPDEGAKDGTVADPPAIGPDDTVEVVVPSMPVGDHLVLVDAPGAGLADDPRRRLLGSLVAAADGAVLVTRADSPLTAPEVDLLRSVRRRAGAALVVTTHTDRHRGWRAVIDESRSTLASAGGGLEEAAILPFAATLAADAELADESGLVALIDAVRAMGADVEGLRSRSLAAMGVDVADELLADERDAAVDARELRRRAADVRESSAATLVRLADEFTLLRESLGPEVARQAAAVTREVNDTVLQDGREPSLVADLAGLLLETAQLSLDARIERRVEDIVHEVLTGERAARNDGEVDDAHAAGNHAPTSRRRRRRGVSASVRLRVVQALVSSGGGATMLAVVGGSGASTADAFRVGALGVGMLVGGLRAIEGVREAKRQRTTQGAKAVLRNTVDGWREQYLIGVRERLLREQRLQEATLRKAFADEALGLESRAAQLEAGGGPGAGSGPDLVEIRARLQAVASRPPG